MSAISSSIFGDSDRTLAVSTFNRLLDCINLPALVGGGFPRGDDRGNCGGVRYLLPSLAVVVVLASCSRWYCWRLSLLFFIKFFGRDHFSCLITRLV